jgi:hypothetical protein
MRSTVVRIALLAATVGGFSAAGTAPALATTSGPCAVTLNGVEMERIDSLSSPLELSATDTLVFAGTTTSPTENARVELMIGPVRIDRGSSTYPSGSAEFSATIDLDEVSPYAVGLFRVRGSTDGCVAEGWLRISGRSPAATLTGLTAAGLALGGVTGLLGAVASRRRGSRFAAAGGGLIAGVGGALLGQELGRLQLSYPSVALAGVGAAAIGFVLGGLIRERSPGTIAEAPVDSGRYEPEPMRPPAAPSSPSSSAEALRPVPTEPDLPRRTPIAEMTGIQPAETSDGPYWCYVLAEVDVFDLSDHTRVIGRLRPGSWYLCKREVGGWAHVAVGDGLDGWVPKGSVTRQG